MDVKNKVFQVYSPEKTGFSDWSHLFRKRPTVDVTLKDAQNGDNNPEWKIYRISREPRRDKDDKKEAEMTDDE